MKSPLRSVRFGVLKTLVFFRQVRAVVDTGYDVVDSIQDLIAEVREVRRASVCPRCGATIDFKAFVQKEGRA